MSLGFAHLTAHLTDEFPRIDPAVIGRSLADAMEQVGDVSRELILKRAREILMTGDGDGRLGGQASPPPDP
jgi:hypothetical protein